MTKEEADEIVEVLKIVYEGMTEDANKPLMRTCTTKEKWAEQLLIWTRKMFVEKGILKK